MRDLSVQTRKERTRMYGVEVKKKPDIGEREAQRGMHNG
jgi:hypothetical protein